MSWTPQDTVKRLSNSSLNIKISELGKSNVMNEIDNIIEEVPDDLFESHFFDNLKSGTNKNSGEVKVSNSKSKSRELQSSLSKLSDNSEVIVRGEKITKSIVSNKISETSEVITKGITFF